MRGPWPTRRSSAARGRRGARQALAGRAGRGAPARADRRSPARGARAQAPPLCAQLVHALGSDAELQAARRRRAESALDASHAPGRRATARSRSRRPTRARWRRRSRRCARCVWRRAARRAARSAGRARRRSRRQARVRLRRLLAVALDGGAGAEGAAASRRCPRSGAARAPYGRAAGPGRPRRCRADRRTRGWSRGRWADERPAREAPADGSPASATAPPARRPVAARARPWDTPLRDDPSDGSSCGVGRQACLGDERAAAARQARARLCPSTSSAERAR